MAQALLTTEMLQDVPFLVLGNKIDLPLAASEPVLRDALGLHDTTGKEVTERVDGQRPIEVFMCSVVRKMGYKDGTHKYPFPLPSFNVGCFSFTTAAPPLTSTCLRQVSSGSRNLCRLRWHLGAQHRSAELATWAQTALLAFRFISLSVGGPFPF